MDDDKILEQVDGEVLLNYVRRVEDLEEERKDIGTNITSIVNEVEAVGYHKKAFRELIKIRKQDRNEREEMEAHLHLYLQKLGE